MKYQKSNYKLFSNLSEKVGELNRHLLEVDLHELDFDNDIFKKGIDLNSNLFSHEQKDFLIAVLENIPEWKRLIGCAQHETHDYCLDIHTLSVIKKIKEYEIYKNSDDYDKLILLYSALLHDIEKYEKEIDPEHPSRGAKKASSILFRLGFSEEFINSVYLLIKYHQILGLLVSEKISFSPGEILEIFKDSSLLKLQSVLSIADIKSVKKNELFWAENMDEKLEEVIKNINDQI